MEGDLKFYKITTIKIKIGKEDAYNKRWDKSYQRQVLSLTLRLKEVGEMWVKNQLCLTVSGYIRMSKTPTVSYNEEI